MSTSSNILVVVAIVIGMAVIGAVALKARLRAGSATGGKPPPSFKRKALLSPNELEFLARLEAAVPELRFHAQVAMGALLDPVVSAKNRSAFASARGMFSQKIVDFVAQRRTDGSVLAVVELDDRTHDREKDDKRDAMLTSAGYRVVRWNAKAKPDAAAIRAELHPPMSMPALPTAGLAAAV